MKNSILVWSVLALAGCASAPAQPGVVTYLWMGKPGEAANHFGSAEKAQVALDRAVGECSIELRQTSSGDFDPEAGVSNACMVAKGWRLDR